MSLNEYRRKRNFRATAEPRGEKRHPTGHSRFVIQKHAASRLHYDFRLEIHGTLKSWAIPKGIPFRKAEKRLAVQVEDHPVSYIDFEGTIPKGQYGGGTVLLWDQGNFDTKGVEPLKAFRDGKISLSLWGTKLKGDWNLIRLPEEPQWLLIKAGKDVAPVSKAMDNTSAKSRLNMEELTQRGTASDKPLAAHPAKRRSHGKAAKGDRRGSEFPRFVQPMLAKPTKTVPHGNWTYELKIDGYRALLLKKGDHMRLLSRNEKDLSPKFPEVLDAAKRLRANEAIIDGELAALDDRGRSSFQLLQAYDMGTEKPPLLYFAFDLLELNGKDLREASLEERKLKLKKLLPSKGIIQFCPALGSDAKVLLQEIRKHGLEGIIGKKAGSRYESGVRSGTWVKLKVTKNQEVVIGGYTEPQGGRSCFGSLLSGVYEAGRLRFCGKIGTGFDNKLLTLIKKKMDALSVAECPFENLPEKKRGRYGQGITPSEMKHCHWVKPRLVCQVAFTEWTRDHKMRHPAFLGLREDKAARDVVREDL